MPTTLTAPAKISLAALLLTACPAYIRPDDVQIADHWQDLTDGDLDAAISVDETKVDHFAGQATFVWTNITADGAFNGYVACDGWNNLAAKAGHVGILKSGGPDWTHHSELPCAFNAHLYCVES